MVTRMLGNDSDAQDAIQEIMIKLWRSRDRLVNHPNPTGFVFLTARNHCLDHLKRKKPILVPSEEHLRWEKSESGHEQFDLLELIYAIEEILKNRPEQHREIIMLRDIDGLEYEEIAAITKLNVQHIRVILSRTRKHVQELLKKKYCYD